MDRIKDLRDKFERGIRQDDSSYQFFPFVTQKNLLFLFASLISLPAIGGPLALLFFEIRQFSLQHEKWSAKYSELFGNIDKKIGQTLFLVFLLLILLVVLPAFAVHMWKLAFRHRKILNMSKEGLFQYGVFLNDSSLMLRIFDNDDNLQEFYIDRDSIVSVNEVATTSQFARNGVKSLHRSIVVTWKENGKAVYIGIDYASLSREDFIKLGKALKAEPAKSESLLI